MRQIITLTCNGKAIGDFKTYASLAKWFSDHKAPHITARRLKSFTCTHVKFRIALDPDIPDRFCEFFEYEFIKKYRTN
jgi:hypothetical protein